MIKILTILILIPAICGAQKKDTTTGSALTSQYAQPIATYYIQDTNAIRFTSISTFAAGYFPEGPYIYYNYDTKKMEIQGDTAKLIKFLIDQYQIVCNYKDSIASEKQKLIDAAVCFTNSVPDSYKASKIFRLYKAILQRNGYYVGRGAAVKCN